MKYAIMSDVHANPVALETALADARALGCEKFAIRRLPFDFKSYVMSMVSHGIDLPAWLLFLLATASR